MTRPEVPRSSSVRELRQWLSNFGDENRAHFEKGQIKAGALTSVRQRIQSLERCNSRLSSESCGNSMCVERTSTAPVSRDAECPIFRATDSPVPLSKKSTQNECKDNGQLNSLHVTESYEEEEIYEDASSLVKEEHFCKDIKSFVTVEELAQDSPRDLALNQSFPSLLDHDEDDDEDDQTGVTDRKTISLYRPSLDIVQDQFRIVSIRKLLDPPKPKRLLDQVPEGWHPNVKSIFLETECKEDESADHVSVHSDGLTLSNETASEISCSRYTDPGLTMPFSSQKPTNHVRPLSFRNKLPMLLCKSVKEQEGVAPKEIESSLGDSSCTTSTTADSIDIRLGSIFGEEIKKQDAAQSTVALGINKWGGTRLDGPNKPASLSAVRRRQEELQRKWDSYKTVTHTKKVTWRASEGKYRKKVVLDYPK